MSKIKVDRISNRAGTGAPEFVNGIKVVGLTSVADVVGGAATFTKLTTTGTLTYEDVTNVDVIGLATYRSGVQFGALGVGGTITADGNVNKSTIPDFIKAGANILVLGSSGLFRKDASIGEAVGEIKESIDKVL